MGFEGSFMPARDLCMASVTISMASSCPTTRSLNLSAMVRTRSLSVSSNLSDGMPVHTLITLAMSNNRRGTLHVSLGIGVASCDSSSRRTLVSALTVRHHLVAEHRLARLLGALLGRLLLRPRRLQLRLQLRQRPVLQLGRLVQVVLPLRLLDLQLHLGHPLLQLVDAQHRLALRLPAGGEVGLLVVEPQEIGLEVLQALRVGVALLRVGILLDVGLDAEAFHLELDDAAIHLVEDGGLGGEFVFQFRAGFVDQVDGCVERRVDA